MEKITEWLKSSFNNDNQGASARKLTAFTLTCCYVAAFLVYCIALWQASEKGNWATSMFTEVLFITLGGISFFLGLVSITQLIQLKNGKNETTINSNTTSSASKLQDEQKQQG
jgi:hypothetical protein